MRQMKLIGMAVMALTAILALSAITMAGTAAAALPEILPTPTATNPIEFSDKGGAGELLTLGGAEPVKCEKNVSSGKATSLKLGTFTIKFEGCKAGIATCTGLKDTSGNITVEKAAFHFWYGELVLNGQLEPAFVILLEETVHFTCGGLVLIEVLKGGCDAGWVLETNKLVKKFEVHFKEHEAHSGDPDIHEVENDEGKLIVCELPVLVNHAEKEDHGAILQLDTIEKFKQGGKEIEVLMMA
jgi:hypothetical protein